MFQENKARPIFRKANISYPLIGKRTCAYQGVRDVRFSGNLACFLFWNPRFEITLLRYYRRNKLLMVLVLFNWNDYIKISISSSIYPSSFTNVRFRTKIEFKNVLYHQKQSWNYCKILVAVSRCFKLHNGFIAESWRGSGGKTPEKGWCVHLEDK